MAVKQDHDAARPMRGRRSWTSYGFAVLSSLLLFSLIVNVWYHTKLNVLATPGDHESTIKEINGPSVLKQGLSRKDPASSSSSSFWKSQGRGQQPKEKRNRQGFTVQKRVSHLSEAGVGSSATTISNKNITLKEARQGREELIQILQDAGVEIQEADAAIVAQLPTWKEVTELYGDQPVIYGLDNEEVCPKFRRTIPLDDASVGVAGLFNTGTNPLAMYLSANCVMPKNKDKQSRGMRWQVPWGKHMLPSRKWNNTAMHDEKVNKTNVLPVVLIRDPYSWMQSMCKHAYGAEWDKGEGGRCPNLVPSNPQEVAKITQQKHHGSSSSTVTYPVKVIYPKTPAHFDSLADFWSAYYQQYLEAEYPRLMVRFEDLIFHQRAMIGSICQCAGAEPKTDAFVYVVGEGKWGAAHQGSSNMISAMIKYGKLSNRLSHFTEQDLEYARGHVHPNLMSLFHYAQPSSTAKAIRT